MKQVHLQEHSVRHGYRDTKHELKVNRNENKLANSTINKFLYIRRET